MKKITLTIDGKERTFTEGSVVEVVFERDIDTPTFDFEGEGYDDIPHCLLYTSPSPRDRTRSRMPSSA